MPYDPKPEIGALPHVYDMRAEQLAALMNGLAARYGRAESRRRFPPTHSA